MNIQVPRATLAGRVGALPPAAIEIEQLCKSYKVYDKPVDFFKEVVTGRPHHREKKALSDISLRIEPGEIVGIVGRNGAGKSTLLKLIAGTLAPTRGTVRLNGRVAAILELGTGFNPQYSGRDNIIMSALMRGMSETEVRRRLDGIIAFSGLEDVIDEPFHTYSTGMQGRLAFAAAVSVDADIIIIDEALSSGDARYAAKSLRRIHDICQSGVTALFVSHTTYFVMQLCTRAVWIDRGRIRMDGPPVEVVRAYEYQMQEEIARDSGILQVGRLDGTVAKALSARVPSRPKTAAAVTGEEVAPAADATMMPSPTAAAGNASGETETLAPALAVLPASEPHPGSTTSQPQDDVPAPAPPPRQTTAAAPQRPDPLLSGGPLGARPDEPARAPYKILDVALLDRHDKPAKMFRLGETLKIQISYQCLLPELPETSCGMAASFARASDDEVVAYFSTSQPFNEDESSEDGSHLPASQHQKERSHRGIIEAVVDPIQMRAGDYYLSVGILPNRPGAVEFYDLLDRHCTISVLANGFDEPSIFYPLVSWTNGPLT